MKVRVLKKTYNTALLASAFLVLTACGGGGGGGGGGDTASAPEPAAAVSAELVAEQQAVLDAESAISAFNDTLFDDASCAADIDCIQAALDAIDPPTAI